MSNKAYPLQWPHGWPRYKSRERSRFKTSVSAALNELERELRMLGAKPSTIVLSSNFTLGNARPADPGVVAYFEIPDEVSRQTYRQMAIPCDRWDKIEDNLKAIALTVAAMRGMDRWGAKHMIYAMFQGFTALPAPEKKRPWREVFGFSESEAVSHDMLNERFRKMAKEIHPDHGGTGEGMTELLRAREEAFS